MQINLFRHLIPLILTLFVSITMMGKAARDYKVDIYGRWGELSSDQLMEKARAYMQAEGMTDSAMLCYSIVANRYYEKKLAGKDLEMALAATPPTGSRRPRPPVTS